ncbi:hypothetical protein UM03808.1 [Pseudozyma hubeiensis SY62]|uniref:Centromere protein H C-terminal domain-containing protein n=1 Tax=Pseudozyma hubeiensis (strain SY62) TaxID=1305764 RepID=R9NVN9_PSEHS|nr:hypothetical protein UM03808.1 [Pseudozyma hubeiensis SY62]GAC92462.1 hypothetical protein UM03808.1 [Pseudozyma hubeiensis SY62]
MTVSPLDALLATFDRHIDSHTAAAAAQRAAASTSEAGPSSLGLRRNELRNLIAPSTSASSSSEAQLSPLERAVYYEVENRRHSLNRKTKELDFWEAYENELTNKPMKMPTSSSALERQIAEKKQRLRQLEAENRLKVETARALESSAVIQKVLSTTSPASNKGERDTDGKHYSSTRELLDERDDQALEFLRVFNEIRSIKEQRVEVKAKIRDQRLDTMKLLENIKSIKADIRNRQLHPAGSATNDPDASQDIAVVQKVQQMQREVNEARSKKELVKGILRGLILESGRDWTKSQSTRALMLSLDDEEDASDDAFSEDEEDGRDDADEEEDEEIDDEFDVEEDADDQA